MMADMNVELGKLSYWRACRCARCARTSAETILNIEAMIHQNIKELLCIDQKSCAKIKRKRKRK